MACPNHGPDRPSRSNRRPVKSSHYPLPRSVVIDPFDPALHRSLGIRAAAPGDAERLRAALERVLNIVDRATLPGDDSTPLYDYLASDARMTVDWARAALDVEAGGEE